MSDWHDDDEPDEWAPPPPRGREGVRIVGDDPEHQAPPVGRFPLPGDEGPSWSAAADPYAPDPPAQPGYDQGYGQPGYEQAPPQHPAQPPAQPGYDQGYEQPGGVQLPHWTDPPTGEVPRVLGGDTSDADFDTWSQVGAAGPRFRTGDNDWAEADWGEGELFEDQTMGVGAHHEDEEVWGPPERGRGRRGRGRGRGAPDVAPPPPPGPGGLEGTPPPQYDEYGGDYPEEHDEGSPADLIPRVITAAVFAGVALLAFAAGRVPAMLLVTVIVGVGAFEVYAAFQRAGYHPAAAIGLLGCVAIVPAAYKYGERAYPIITVLVMAFTFLWYLIEVVRARPVVNIGLTLLPFMWIGICGGFAGMMLAPDPAGTGLLLGVVICAVGADIASYFGGRAFGRTPLLPRVSPNKTVEGALAGAGAAVILGAIVGNMLHPWADKGIGAGLFLGILVAITVPLGDLVESMIKRDLGVKDIGGFLPGHGGFLDRFDGVLFALPLAFYWALHLFTG